jgi:hypothetical protein
MLLQTHQHTEKVQIVLKTFFVELNYSSFIYDFTSFLFFLEKFVVKTVLLYQSFKLWHVSVNLFIILQVFVEKGV